MIRNVSRQSAGRYLNEGFSLRCFSTEKQTTALYSWGVGTNGQLGHAKYTKEPKVFGDDAYIQEEPRRLVKSKSFTTVAVGGTYTLALNESGQLFGWGDRFGKTVSSVPQILSVEKKYTHISAGSKHAAAVDTDGQVHTWGDGGGWFQGGGQLGHDNYDSVEHPKLVKAFQKYGAKASNVAVGEDHTIILTTDGETMGCGVGESGRVGNGSTSDVKVPSPLDVLLDDTIVQIATGSHHTIVLTDDGKVYTWGKNDTGALGHGDSQNDVYSLEEYPRLLEWPDTKDEHGADIIDKNKELDPIVSIAAGSGRSAAISRSGKLFLWGRTLGHIPAVLNSTALDGQKVVKVALGGAAGRSVVAIITEDNSLWTFGDGGSKLLGIKDLPNWKHPAPLKVTAFQDKKVLDIYCGVGQHIFAKVIDE